MKLTMSRIVIVACGLLMAAAAQAQQSKIGFVNRDRIFSEAAPAKAAQAKLEQEFGKRQKDLQDQAARLKSLSDKLEKDAPTLSDSERQRRQQEIADLDRQLQRRDRELREDFNARRNEELQALLDRANKVIREVAQQEKIDIVLQDAVYVNPAIDMTDRVLKALNSAK
jgi:outer membrane protein